MNLEQILYQKLNNNKPAVSEKQRDWSYDTFARYAFYARDFFVENDIKRIFITLPQGFYTYALMWGSYLAGTTFCPINEDIPAERKDYYIKQYEPDFLFGPQNGVDAFGAKYISPESFFEVIPATDPIIRNLEIDPVTTAYVIFTSGSTGLPKGVMVPRKALAILLEFSTNEFKPNENDRWGQYSNIGFDLTVCDTFTTIIGGATLFPLNRAEKLLPGLFIKNKKLTMWRSVPSAIDLMSKTGHITTENIAHLRVMIFGGERLFPSQLKLLFDANPKLIVYNVYGPTETTIFSTFKKLTSENYHDYCDKTVCIGNPIPKCEVFLRDVDENGMGELIIVGDVVGTGYLGVKNDLPSSKFQFIEHGNETKWSYATGDYVIYKNDVIFFITRKDTQLKIKGHRIDLSEIDHWLRECGCTACVTVGIDDKIISFIVSDLSEAYIKSYLKGKLPVYYIPDKIIYKENLPYGNTGKIDSKELISEFAN